MALLGKINLNLGTPHSYDAYFPHLNYFQSGEGVEVLVSGVTYHSGFPLGHSESAWPYLDVKGYLKNPIPANCTRYRRTWHGISGALTPTGYTVAGKQFVILYDGGGGVSSIEVVSSTINSTAAGRVVFTMNDNGNSFVTFNVTPGGVPPTNIRIVPLVYEDIWNAGKRWHPEWSQEVFECAGIIRFTGWQQHYIGWRTQKFTDFIPVDYFTQFSAGGAAFAGGVSLELLVGLCIEAQCHFWPDTPFSLGSKITEVWGITNANPAVVTTYPNTWEAAEAFYPIWNTGGTDWNAPWSNTEQTVVSVSGDTITTDFDASANDAFVVESVKALLISPLSLAAITTEATPYYEYIRDNLRYGLMLFNEVANEPFLQLWRSKDFWQMHGRILYPALAATDVAAAGMKAYGYIVAHHQKICRDVFGASFRNRWKGMLSGWTANPGTYGSALSGVQDYIDTNAPTLVVNDLIDYAHCTGYWGGFHGSGNKAYLSTLADTSTALNGSDPGNYPTIYTHYSQIANEERLDGRHKGSSNTIALLRSTVWPAIKVQVDPYPGVKMAMYEGSGHDEASLGGLYASYGVGEEAERDRIMTFLTESLKSPLHADLHRIMFEEWEEFGGEYPS
ncbi:MAG TPA: hypothetical protein VFI87_12020, partial [Hyphomicrobiaceae bacterium]|nr:hypothetical protein [Hyphomicrobiaceae bacterium]